MVTESYGTSVKDYQVGQTVYLLRQNTGRIGQTTEDRISEGLVTKVGRIYLTVDVNNTTCRLTKSDSGTFPYLVEDQEYGWPRLLFPTLVAAQEYEEAEELRKWLHKAASLFKSREYSLAQLRAVKVILDDDSGE